jgi:uncharacterized protein
MRGTPVDAPPRPRSTARTVRSGRVRTALIDCDVHAAIPAARLARELPSRWRRYFEDVGLRPNTSTGYVRPRAVSQMLDAWPPGGGMPGSDPGFVVQQLLDPCGHTYAIVNPGDQMNLGVQQSEYAAALERALNDVTPGPGRPGFARPRSRRRPGRAR